MNRYHIWKNMAFKAWPVTLYFNNFDQEIPVFVWIYCVSFVHTNRLHLYFFDCSSIYISGISMWKNSLSENLFV